MKRRRHVYYWHHAPEGWWWLGNGGRGLVRLDERVERAVSSVRNLYSRKAALRSLRRYGGLLVRMVPVRGGVIVAREWGDWDLQPRPGPRDLA